MFSQYFIRANQAWRHHIITKPICFKNKRLITNFSSIPIIHLSSNSKIKFPHVVSTQTPLTPVELPPVELPPVEPAKEGTYEKVRKELARHLSVASQFRNGLLMAGTFIVVSGSLLWLFKNQVKDKLVVQTSDITKRSLEDNNVQQQVNHLSHDVVSRILADPQIFKHLLTLISNLSHDQEVASDVSSLLSQAISRQQFKDDLILLFKDLIKDPETQAQINSCAKLIVADLLKDESLRTDLINYLRGILDDQQIHQSMSTATLQCLKLTVIPRWFRNS